MDVFGKRKMEQGQNKRRLAIVNARPRWLARRRDDVQKAANGFAARQPMMQHGLQPVQGRGIAAFCIKGSALLSPRGLFRAAFVAPADRRKDASHECDGEQITVSGLHNLPASSLNNVAVMVR